jgi:hypothetical protein
MEGTELAAAGGGHYVVQNVFVPRALLQGTLHLHRHIDLSRDSRDEVSDEVTKFWVDDGRLIFSLLISSTLWAGAHAEEWLERGNTECVRRDVHFDQASGAITAVREPSTSEDAGESDATTTVVDGTNKLLLPGCVRGAARAQSAQPRRPNLREMTGARTHTGS